MLAVDAPCIESRVRQNSVYTMEYVTTEEIYASRRRLVSSLLKCQLYLHERVESKNISRDGSKSHNKQNPIDNCKESKSSSTICKRSSNDHKTSPFHRSSNKKDKSAESDSSRDSGFFDRISLVSQGSNIDQSEYSHSQSVYTRDNCYSSPIKVQHTSDSCSTIAVQHNTLTVQRLADFDTAAGLSSSSKSQSFSKTCHNSRRNHCECDSESIVSSYTLTDSQNTDSDSGMRVNEEYKSKRKQRPKYLGHQDSMFNAAKKSLLYFPKHWRKAQIIRVGPLQRY